MKPLVIDIFCGLGGWSEAFLEEGYRTVGIDIEVHDYGNGRYPGELLVRDVRSVMGSELVKQYGVPACIVASPPCQEFSYMAMPWTKAKDKMRKILADPAEQVRLCDLFNQCFRIQREVSEAAGHYVPMVIENVRGAQRWVGRAQWNFGSFYLWGDVPALMPVPSKRVLKYGKVCYSPGEMERIKNGEEISHPNSSGHKLSGFRFDGSGKSFQSASVEQTGFKSQGLNWSDPTKRGQDFTRVAGRQALEGVKVPSEVSGRRTAPGKGARFTSRDCGTEGTKNGKDWFGSGENCSVQRLHGSKSSKRKEASALIAKIPKPLAQSKSSKRKEASALIAKIPKPLAQWIAQCFKPK